MALKAVDNIHLVNWQFALQFIRFIPACLKKKKEMKSRENRE